MTLQPELEMVGPPPVEPPLAQDEAACAASKPEIPPILELRSTDTVSPDARPPAAMPPGLAPWPTPAVLLEILGRCWPRAVLAGLLGAALVILSMWSLFPERETAQYQAESWLELALPNPADPPVREESDNPDRQAAAIASARIKSPRILEEMLRRPEIGELPDLQNQSQPLAWLERTLTVETPGPTVLRLRAASPHPGSAAVLVRTLRAVYLQQMNADNKAQAQHLQKAIHRAEQKRNGLQLTLAPAEDPRRGEIEKAIQQARYDRQKLQAEITVQQTREKELATLPAPELLLQEQLKKDEAANNLTQEIQRVEEVMRKIVLVSARGDKDPLMAKQAQLRETLQQQLAGRKRVIAQGLEQQARSQAQEEYRALLLRLQDQIRASEELEKRLQTDLKNLGPEPSKVGELETKALKQELAQEEDNLRQLRQQLQGVEKTTAALAGVADLGATETTLTSRQARPLLAMGGAAAGMFMVLLLMVALREFYGRRIHQARDVAVGLELPVLAVLPAPSPGGATAGQTAGQPEPFDETVDVLRTLLLRSVGEGPKVILITSAAAREGKTWLAQQLASSLGRAWRRTLLIDGNLREPRLHALLETNPDPGLSEVLRGEIDLVEAVQPTRWPRLCLLAAGHCNSHALQALAQAREERLFEVLKEHYDYILIDGASVLSLADPLLLAQQADGVLLAVRCEDSRLPAVHQARMMLAAIGAPVLGAVVIGPQSK